MRSLRARRIRVVSLLGLLCFGFTFRASSIPNTSSFTTAKKQAMDITSSHREDLYCGCVFDETGSISDDLCGYVPRNMFTGKGDLNVRAMRIEWEHIVTASRMGKGRKCWEQRTSFPACQYASGRWKSSRECCRVVDPEFKAMEADMHNLWPAVGELNADRSDTEFGFIAGESRVYGACDFEVMSHAVEVRVSVQGEIARAYLYMADTWGVSLTQDEREMYQDWNKGDPPSEWELERERRITAIQGVPNTYVTKHTRVNDGRPCVLKSTCCKVCANSIACGDACISKTRTCTMPSGCACDGSSVCP